MASKQEFGRPLSEAQRQHLTQLILNMRVAAAKLDAANSIMAAQVESAEKEFDTSQEAANAFLRYCGNEHGVTFDDGQWGFDEPLMCFVRRGAHASEVEPEPAVNGKVEHAQNLT